MQNKGSKYFNKKGKAVKGSSAISVAHDDGHLAGQTSRSKFSQYHPNRVDPYHKKPNKFFQTARNQNHTVTKVTGSPEE